MKIFKKDIPLAIVIAIIFVAGAGTYSIGYNMAMRKFNNIVSYVDEREHMYEKLSEIDRSIRQEYIGYINEDEIIAGICAGYISGMNDSLCRYLTPDEYKQFASKKVFDENLITYKNIDDKIGYIKINILSPEMGNTFFNTLKNLYDSGISKIVLDIRGLSGTNIESVCKCLDSIADNSNMISKIDKKGNKEDVYKMNSDRMDINFSVIIDRDTSGTPELIAEVLKDCDYGTVVGETTKGNCVEEKAIPLSDGSGIVFPTANYVTKNGEILTGKGVTADIEVILDNEKRELLKKGELEFEDDIQIQEAIKTLL